MPGFGSIVGGRRVGYVQAVLYLVAFAITLVAGTRFIAWALSNREALYGHDADQLTAMIEMWRAARWPLIGIAGFIFTWLWSLSTSLSILQAAKRQAAISRVPPKL